MKRNLYKKSTCMVMCIVLFTSCNNYISNTDYIKNSFFVEDYSMNIGDMLDNYQYFTKTEWKEFTTERGQEIVEFNGYYYQKHIIVRIQFTINKDRLEDDKGATFKVSYVGHKFLYQNDNESLYHPYLMSCIIENSEIIDFKWIENPIKYENVEL